MMIPNALERAAAVVYIVVPSEVTPILPDMPEALLAAAAAAAAAATALALKHNETRSVRNIFKDCTLFWRISFLNYSGDLNTGNILIPNFLKLGF